MIYIFAGWLLLLLTLYYLTLSQLQSPFFRWWHAWKSSEVTTWSVRKEAMQIFSSSSSLLIDAGAGFTSIDSPRWYWILLTAFLSSWIIRLLRRRLQFFEKANSEDRISNLLVKSSNRLDFKIESLGLPV